MALSENGHIAETEGKKMHHEEGIVIVGGGLGGLCFAAALHKYIITPYFQIVIMIS
jgi:NADH dehydrogenase FAD-containing subunit